METGIFQNAQWTKSGRILLTYAKVSITVGDFCRDVLFK